MWLAVRTATFDTLVRLTAINCKNPPCPILCWAGGTNIFFVPIIQTGTVTGTTMETKSTMPSNQLPGKSTSGVLALSHLRRARSRMGDMGSNGARRPFAAGMGHGTGGGRRVGAVSEVMLERVEDSRRRARQVAVTLGDGAGQGSSGACGVASG